MAVRIALHDAWSAFLLLAAACGGPPIEGVGERGRSIPLESGDASSLLRLAFVDEGCPGASARGGCPDGGGRTCQTLVLDSLVPLTAIGNRDPGDDSTSFGRECLEVRQSQGLAAAPPAAEDSAAAVTRFRFLDVPTVRAPAAGTDTWSWAAGDELAPVAPRGVIGGNIMRQFAVAVRRPRIDPTQSVVTLYGEYPGTETNLADQGLAFLPLQFPGRLLGRDIYDRCAIGSSGCDVAQFSLNLQGTSNIALQSTRMVLDACLAVPPCGVRYVLDATDPLGVGTCKESVGPASDTACVDETKTPELGGRSASLMVATGVPGLVLFDDSARRMFGALAELPTCDAVTPDDLACRDDENATLFLSGWAPAGDPSRGDPPLFRLRVRSVAIVPGLTRARGQGPCTRARERVDALETQCHNFTVALGREGSIASTSPPYAANAAD